MGMYLKLGQGLSGAACEIHVIVNDQEEACQNLPQSCPHPH